MSATNNFFILLVFVIVNGYNFKNAKNAENAKNARTFVISHSLFYILHLFILMNIAEFLEHLVGDIDLR